MRHNRIIIILALFIIISFSSMQGSAQAAKFSTPSKDSALPSQENTTIESVEYIGDVFSEWIRLVDVKIARRDGEKGQFTKSKTVKITSSLDASIPISKLSTKLGFKVEKTLNETLLGDVSAPLKKSECTAFYYRKRFQQYKVTMMVETRTANLGGKYDVRTEEVTKYVSIPVELEPEDYGWFYADDKRALGKTLDDRYCADDYSCRVN